MQQADGQSLAGFEDLGAREQPARMAAADRVHHVRRDHCRHQAQFHLRQRELRLVHADGVIAAGHQAHAAAVGRAVHPGQGRLGQEVQGAHQLGQAQRVGPVFFFAGLGHAAHPAQVGAGREGAAFAGQHHGAHVRVGVGVFQGGGEVGDKGVVEGVVHGRPVQGEAGDGTFAVKSDSRGHAVSSGQAAMIPAGLRAPAPAGCCRGRECHIMRIILT